MEAHPSPLGMPINTRLFGDMVKGEGIFCDIVFGETEM